MNLKTKQKGDNNMKDTKICSKEFTNTNELTYAINNENPYSEIIGVVYNSDKKKYVLFWATHH